jgi:hypothetical protein
MARISAEENVPFRRIGRQFHANRRRGVGSPTATATSSGASRMKPAFKIAAALRAFLLR